MDVTFVVTGDTHFGVPGIAARHRDIIADMNALPGRPFPTGMGGTVGEPRGVLIAGDLTDDSRPEEWAEFVAHYGLRGNDGLLR
jgi:3',5'-cyclic AMP phosphodiesterase CpdA